MVLNAVVHLFHFCHFDALKLLYCVFGSSIIFRSSIIVQGAMLKCRFRVSICHLFTGYSGLVSARKIVPPITNIQLKGFETLKQSLHTSTDDGDDFAELGLPVERVGGLIRKLMTEKPDPFMKINGTKKKLHRPVKADGCLNIKDVSRKLWNSTEKKLQHSPVKTDSCLNIEDVSRILGNSTEKKLQQSLVKTDSCLTVKDVLRKVGNSTEKKLQQSPIKTDSCLTVKDVLHEVGNSTEKKLQLSPVKTDSCLTIKDVLRKVGNATVPSPDLQNNNDGVSDFETSRSVTIKDVPSTIDSLELVEAISVFGKVSKASMRSVPNGLDCCDIQFKRMKSSKKALSVGYITVKKLALSIWPLQPLKAVTIRISNISLETPESAIHTACKLCGLLKGLVRMKEGVVDALFNVACETDTQSILNKLNATVMDESKWSADIQYKMSENCNAEDDLGFKIVGHLADLEREIRMKKIYVEDLQHLHRCVLHLENDPLKC